MRSAFLLWKDTQMIVLVAVCAAIYAATLFAFKTAIPLIPGITEVRVAGIFPIVLGFLLWSSRRWSDRRSGPGIQGVQPGKVSNRVLCV